VGLAGLADEYGSKAGVVLGPQLFFGIGHDFVVYGQEGGELQECRIDPGAGGN
jgi:hypothetical protein